MPTRFPPAPPDVNHVALAAMRGLRARRNPARAPGVQAYFKHTVISLGIDTPTLRDYARDLAKPLVPAWNQAEAVRLCDLLLDEPELEVRGLGILVLSAFRRVFTPDLIPPATRWLETRLDNWALVDSFCGSVLSPLLEACAEMETTLRAWSRHSCLWVRRAALVTLVPAARRGQRLDLVYALAQAHFPDHEDLMHKATGWLLREAGKTDMARLERFLRRHGPTIPRTALRYAIERFASPKRAELLRTTRPAPAKQYARRASMGH